MSYYGQKLKQRRKELKLTMLDVAKKVGVSEATISRWESGDIANMKRDKIVLLAQALKKSPTWIMESDDATASNITEIDEIISFPELGSVKAGFDGTINEYPTGKVIDLPSSFISGEKDDYFTLRVTGDSMYPRLIDGDSILVKRCSSVDSGTIAVVLYNGDEATVKKVKYVNGEDWMELIPINPEYTTKRIEGPDLEQCRVLGKVVKLIRDF